MDGAPPPAVALYTPTKQPQLPSGDHDLTSARHSPRPNHRSAYPVNSTPMVGLIPRYLAFLRFREDGRFEPVTDQYESGFSFRVLTTPTLGETHYYVDRSREGRHDGEPVGPANGSQPMRSETNSTSTAADSRR